MFWLGLVVGMIVDVVVVGSYILVNLKPGDFP